MIKPQIVNKLKSINELKVLEYLAFSIATGGFGEWYNTTCTRGYIQRTYDIADVTIKKTLKKLVDKGILIKPSKGVYTINKDVIQ